MKLSAVAVLLLMSCAASQSSAPPEPWRLAVTTSGGITGRGNGGWAIDDEGKIAVTSMGGKRCAFEATAAERSRFDTLFAKARPETWRTSYVPENPCCDRIEYTMTIDHGGTQREVKWVDDPAPMPADLEAIVNAVIGVPSVRTEYGDKCM
ncbi:MAG TPA: hypothetical protein VE010_12915 [Thermoanaerobaculia bacterium]|nr:hypothetical protein [Thermoanaerobaculia bacterium]